MGCCGNCEECDHYDPAPIVSGNFSGYCELYDDACDNVLANNDFNWNSKEAPLWN